MKPLISVVVPFYNEEDNVPLMAQQIHQVLSVLPNYEYECLFVNDGSKDGTRAALEKVQSEFPQMRAIHFKTNHGQSAAVLYGLRQAKGDYLFTLDGDLQNDPCDIPAFLELLKDCDCVCGYRAKRNDSFIRLLSSKVGNGIRNLALGDGVRDSGCGSKGFRRDCIPHLVPFNGAHRFIPAVLQAAGKKIVEAPVTHHPREHGVSKYGINNRLWRGLYDLIGVAWLRRRFLAIEDTWAE